MKEETIFWCSRCKFDHGGECGPKGCPVGHKGAEGVPGIPGPKVLNGLQLLIKALEAGSYNAAPSPLTQGCELKVDWDLDMSMFDRLVVFKSEHIKLRKQTEQEKQELKNIIANYPYGTIYHEFDGTTRPANKKESEPFIKKYYYLDCI